jgi:hypothetical protein
MVAGLFVGLAVFLYPEDLGLWKDRLETGFLIVRPFLTELSYGLVFLVLEQIQRISSIIRLTPIPGLLSLLALFAFLWIGESIVILFWLAGNRRSKIKYAGLGVFVPIFTIVGFVIFPTFLSLLLVVLILLISLMYYFGIRFSRGIGIIFDDRFRQ